MLKKIYVNEDAGFNPHRWTLSYGKPEFQGGDSIEVDEETAREILKTQNISND